MAGHRLSRILSFLSAGITSDLRAHRPLFGFSAVFCCKSFGFLKKAGSPSRLGPSARQGGGGRRVSGGGRNSQPKRFHFARTLSGLLPLRIASGDLAGGFSFRQPSTPRFEANQNASRWMGGLSKAFGQGSTTAGRILIERLR